MAISDDGAELVAKFVTYADRIAAADMTGPDMREYQEWLSKWEPRLKEHMGAEVYSEAMEYLADILVAQILAIAATENAHPERVCMCSGCQIARHQRRALITDMRWEYD